MSDPQQRKMLATIKRRAAVLDAAKDERDAAIREAFAAGVPRQAIADAAGITPARVYQIIDGR